MIATNCIKVIIVEDHSILRETMVEVLNKEEDIDVLGHWSKAEEALKYLETHSVDVVISDNRLPGMDGVTFTRRIKQQYPDLKVIMLSMITDEEKIFEALEAGVMGYLPKEISKNELVMAIIVMRIKNYIIHSIRNHLLPLTLHSPFQGLLAHAL